MKSTGIVRQIDDLGRIVIPKELRTDEKGTKDSYKFFMDGRNIVLKNYEPGCIFCGSTNNNFKYQEITICKDCYEKMGNEVE